MKKVTAWIAMLCCALMAAGCQTMTGGGAPRQSFNLETDIKALSAQFNTPETIPRYYALNNDTSRLQERNKFIVGRLALIDLNYLQYVRSLTADKQLMNIGAELANMSLGLAGTLVGGVRAKTNLAAAATGLSGTKTTIDKEIYYEQSMNAIIGSMNAARKELLVGILTGLKTNTVVDYPFEIALVRLDEYYMAGTIKGALTFITTKAAVEEKVAVEKIEELTETTDAIVDTKRAIRAAIQKADEVSARKTLNELNESMPGNATLAAMKARLLAVLRGIGELESLEKKEAETQRIKAAFQNAGLM